MATAEASLFFSAEPLELCRLEFSEGNTDRVIVRGKPSKDNPDLFEWRGAVKAFTVLLLRYAAWGRRGCRGPGPVLSGKRPSAATSLDDAISSDAPPMWLLSVFGTTEGGSSRLLGIVDRQNSGARVKHLPVRVSFLPDKLPPDRIEVFIGEEESPVESDVVLDEMAEEIGKSEPGWGRQNHVEASRMQPPRTIWNELRDLRPVVSDLCVIGYAGRRMSCDLMDAPADWSINRMRVLLHDFGAIDPEAPGSLPKNKDLLEHKQADERATVYDLYHSIRDKFQVQDMRVRYITGHPLMRFTLLDRCCGFYGIYGRRPGKHICLTSRGVPLVKLDRLQSGALLDQLQDWFDIIWEHGSYEKVVPDTREGNSSV